MSTIKFVAPTGDARGPLELHVPEGETEIEFSPELIGQLVARYAKPGHREGDVSVRIPVSNAVAFFESLGFTRVFA